MRYNFSNDEHGFFIELAINDEPMRLDWETTMLFTHRNLDYHDHIFIDFEQDSENPHQHLGAFIWRQVLPDWQDLADQLIKYDFPHLHSPWPNEHDVESYRQSGLVVPKMKELVVIEEVEDEDEVLKAMAHIDEEIDYFLGEFDE